MTGRKLSYRVGPACLVAITLHAWYPHQVAGPDNKCKASNDLGGPKNLFYETLRHLARDNDRTGDDEKDLDGCG